jgi:hypothetical protein
MLGLAVAAQKPRTQGGYADKQCVRRIEEDSHEQFHCIMRCPALPVNQTRRASSAFSSSCKVSEEEGFFGAHAQSLVPISFSKKSIMHRYHTTGLVPHRNTSVVGLQYSWQGVAAHADEPREYQPVS